MTSPKLKSEHEPSRSLDRLVDDARRLRPMLDAERGALWSRLIESRAARSPSPRRWLVACGAVALALAALPLATPNGLLRGEAPPAEAPPAQAIAAPSAAQSAPALSAAPSAASGSAADAPAAPSRAEPVIRHAERLVSLGNRGELVLDADADVQLPTPFDPTARRPLSIRLDRGSVRASVAARAPEEPFSIVTPHVSVVVVGTRFTVSVEATRTTVSVEEGRVRVDQAGHTVLLDAGQSIRSNDARFQGERELDRVEAPPLAPTSRTPTSRAPTSRTQTSRTQTSRAPVSRAPAAPSAEFCEGDSVTRRTCLLRTSQGIGLTAENALFALALLERDELADRGAALARLDEYERRHPRGVLAPEVALARVETLLGDGRPEAARAAAAEHARRFPDDLATSRRLTALIDAYDRAGRGR
jgi:hypothetical protein